ncbi:MAG TPA: hypothetical protein VJT82_03555, partial [Pyrinomonadaceae bacterium]|nr:hypothetical protein [Pyrinomonadaceae bacterium]
MKKRTKRNVTSKNRRSERGAALIMMLLISMLLLAAGGALIMTTALSTTTLYESTPETQAYYAAEAGLEDAMAVLRGNVAPQGGGAAAPLGGFMASVAPGGGSTTTTTITDAQKISLRRAVEHATSDAANDPAAAPQLRLSRWLTYNYTPPSGTYPDRVALVDNYSPLTGTAYNLTVRDPDNAKSVAYTTGGTFNNVPGVTLSNAGKTISVENRNLLGILLGTTTITYEPRADNTTFPAYPPATKDLGQFRITSTGIGATIPPGVSFSLNVSQSAPWQANATIRATFSSFLNLGLLTPKVTFLKDTLKLDGTAITLVNKILDLLLPPVGGTAVVPVQANVNAPEPKRIIVRSTGIGPKGARKVLEMVVKRANLDFEAPATLTMRGADDCAPMTFSTGSSNAKEYKGDDVDHPGDPNYSRPAFAVSGCDYDDAVNGTSKPGTVSGSAQIGILGNGTAPAGSMSQAPVETPYFLEDANKA